MNRGRTVSLTALAATVIAASLLVCLQDLPGLAGRAPAAPPAGNPLTLVAGQASTVTPSQLTAEIARARQAIAGQIGQPPLSGPINQRPPFVSELEWRVLSGVALTHSDPPAELTLLVNRLRFTRLEAFWRGLPPDPADSDLRNRLARQLLDEIPGRVRERQLDLAEAQALQQQLLDGLVTDPMERLQRASEESRRLSPPGTR